MFNARSIRNKFPDLQILAASEDYQIIGVSELWLDTRKEIFQQNLIYPVTRCLVAREEIE